MINVQVTTVKPGLVLPSKEIVNRPKVDNWHNGWQLVKSFETQSRNQKGHKVYPLFSIKKRLFNSDYFQKSARNGLVWELLFNDSPGRIVKE